MILAKSPFSLFPRLKIVSKRCLLGPLVWILCRNLGSSSVASSLQDVLPVGRAHADAKSMRLAAFSIIRLKCALHSWSLFRKVCTPESTRQLQPLKLDLRLNHCDHRLNLLLHRRHRCCIQPGKRMQNARIQQRHHVQTLSHPP
jgi:hypothetical protein